MLEVFLLPLLLSHQEPASNIRVDDLKAHIGYLASEELEGRESGERGGHLAAKYVARHFEQLGLKPLGEKGSYLLPFTIRGKGTTAYNVAGVLPGTETGTEGGMLVIGGHHDHAGIGGPGAMGFPGEIHNGADDNASGTAGVIELAEWFAAHPPKHPIMFVTFSAEERGLWGSQALVAEGPVPVKAMRAMINLDMIGRSESGYLFIGGLGTADEFHTVLDPVLAASTLKLETKDDGQAPSDNSSFHDAGVPALFFFTNVHDDYHLPTDDADKINYEGEVQILQLVRKVAMAIDGHAGAITYHQRPGMAMPDDFMDRMRTHYTLIAERRNLKGKLGITPSEATGGLAIGAVSEGSAAAAAGLQAGDMLIRIGERDIRTLEDLRRALGSGLRGDVVKVTIERAGKRNTLDAVLK
ncbi:MAG TPA: M28 family peptidase [Planctomycetota bacterium]